MGVRETTKNAKIAKVRLGDVCQVVSGATPKTSVKEYWDGEFAWVTPAELKGEVVVTTTERKLTKAGLDSCSLKLIPQGAVLLTSRAPIGKVAIAGCDMYCNQGFKNLVCSETVHNLYLYYWLKSNGEYLNSLGRGATFKEISKTIVENIKIPLPSLLEQKRIAEELDQICELKKNAEERLALMDELVKSRFVEMFGDPVQNNRGWPLAHLQELATKIGSGATPKGGKSSYAESGVSFIRSMNVHDARFKYDDLAYLTDSQAKELSNVEVRSLDVLLNITGASVARSCVVPDDVMPARVNQHVAIIRPVQDKLDSCFLNAMFISGPYKRLLLNLGDSNGATRQAITKGQIENLALPLPPIGEQRKFAAFVAEVDKSKFVLRETVVRMETLYKAKLQEYFG